MKCLMKRFVSLLLVVTLIISLPLCSVTVYAADIPRPTDPYTQKGMLALLKEYNADAYHIVSTVMLQWRENSGVKAIISTAAQTTALTNW